MGCFQSSQRVVTASEYAYAYSLACALMYARTHTYITTVSHCTHAVARHVCIRCQTALYEHCAVHRPKWGVYKALSE